MAVAPRPVTSDAGLAGADFASSIGAQGWVAVLPATDSNGGGPPERGDIDPHRERLDALGADQTIADADETASDVDQTAADRDQGASELDEQSSREDRAGAAADQRASDRDQATADEEEEQPAPSSSGTAAWKRDREASRVERKVTTAERAQTSIARAHTAIERLDHADQRDLAARARDLASQARDLTAEARDKVADQYGHESATSARRRAARDRQRAADDRVHAADDRDVMRTDREDLREALSEAHIDDLTGTYRRAMGRIALQAEIDRAHRTHGRLVLAFVDVDDLKLHNDRGGHAGGDALLRDVVSAIRAHLRSYDPVVRFGGDEFVCALCNADLSDASRRFSEIKADLRRKRADASVSVGFAAMAAGDTLEGLVARGDAELYRAKAAK